MNPELSATASTLPLLVVDRREAASRSGPSPSRAAVWLRNAAVLVLVAVLGIAGMWVTPGGFGVRAEPSAPAQPALPMVVVALGKLAPLGELRSLASPFGASDARVAEVLVTEGQHVSAGATLVVFDNAAALQAAWRLADAQLASRQAALAQAERNVTSSQAESGAALARAEVAARAAETEYQRWAALVGQGFASPAAADQRRALRDEAAEELRRARAVAVRHAGIGDFQPDLRAARQAVAVAMAERDRATQDLSRAMLVAPADGRVVALHARPGERPGTAGVLDFGDTRFMAAELELYQGDVARVRVGQRVWLRSTALREELVGQVSHLGLNVGRQQRIDTSPAANLDARVVKATVTLDAASSARARSLVGLEVRAHIETGSP